MGTNLNSNEMETMKKDLENKFFEIEFNENNPIIKDGDCIIGGSYDSYNPIAWISICKKGTVHYLFEIFHSFISQDYVRYTFLAWGDQEEFEGDMDYNVTSIGNEIRHATLEEKTIFLKFLEEKYGKHWDEEKKCFHE